MRNIETLKNIQRGQNANVTKLTAINEALNAEVTRYEADTTRSQAFVAEQIKAAREKALPTAQKLFDTIRDTAKATKPQLQFWNDRTFLLSQQRFESDPAQDALVRAATAATLDRMPLPLLTTTCVSAVEDGNLALAWECQVTSSKQNVDQDLSALAIPDQAVALAAIHDIVSVAPAAAELAMGAIEGRSIDPIRKLTLGRAMSAPPAALAA